MDQALITRLEQAVRDQVFPGAVLGIVNKQGERKIFSVGHFTYEPGATPVQADTIYDLASVTKSIPGSCSLLKLIDEGKLSLEDRLVDYVPEFDTAPDKQEVRIKHLLTYTLDLDLSSMSAFKEKTAEEMIALVMQASLKSVPGTRYVYSNATAGFFPLIIKAITGQTLDVYADENFFIPLGMLRSTFFPERFSKTEIAPTEIDPWRRRVIQGEVHDESSFVLRSKYITAAAGLFSTAPDLLNFLEMLLNGGTKDGWRYLSEAMVAQMHTNQLTSATEQAGLGWVINWPEGTGTNSSPDTFSKSGFTGTVVVVDPTKGVAFTLLSNRTYPTRPKDNSAIVAVRGDLGNVIFA